MPVYCKICNHKLRAQAEAQIVAGTPIKAIARELDLPYQSLDRHSRICIRKAIAKREAKLEKREAALADRLIEQIEALQQITAEIMLRAKSAALDTEEFDTRAAEVALKAVKEARGNLELVAKLTGKLKPAEDTAPGTLTLEQINRIVAITSTSSGDTPAND